MPENAIHPSSDDERAMFRELVSLLRERPKQWTSSGAALDAEYKAGAIRKREAERKNAWHKLGREQRRHSTEFSTRAAWRKCGKRGIAPSAVQVKAADGRFHRLPPPKASRFQRAWQDTLRSLASRPFDHRVQEDRVAMALRVSLLTWLMIDPDAHTFRPILTEFQDWPWELDLEVLEHAEDTGQVLWTPDGAPMPIADRLLARKQMREELLDAKHLWGQWLYFLRDTIEVVAVIEGAHQGEEPGQDAGVEYVSISEAAARSGMTRGIVKGWLKRERGRFGRNARGEVCYADISKRVEEYHLKQAAKDQVDEKAEDKMNKTMNQLDE